MKCSSKCEVKAVRYFRVVTDKKRHVRIRVRDRVSESQMGWGVWEGRGLKVYLLLPRTAN